MFLTRRALLVACASLALVHPTSAQSPQNEMVQLINELRASYGVPLLRESCILDQAAQGKAEDFNNSGYFGHVNPTTGWGGNEWKEWAGYAANSPGFGENVLWSGSSVEDAFNIWVASEPHFENMVSTNYTEVGVGIASGDLYWGVYVLEFGSATTASCDGSPSVTATATKEPVPQSEGISTTDNLNVRAAPSETATILGVLPAYTLVILTGERQDAEGHIWLTVEANGLQGWVASEYLSGVVTSPYGEEAEPVVDAASSPIAVE